MKRYLFPWAKSEVKIFHTDVLVLGSGIAGLYSAIKASEHLQVTVVTKKNIEESNTEHAQGGIAAAMDDEDSPDLHYEDTLLAGAGLCDPESVHILVEEGPGRVEELIGMGAHFDRHEGELAFTMEGAHSRRRVLHANGDATGGEIQRTLVAETRRRSGIEVKEGRFVVDLLQNSNGAVAGALVFHESEGILEGYLAKSVVLATGGLGRLFGYTTNPEVATGDGIAAAYRAGAELMDMEFVQFHPTALLLPGAPRFLISEAVRGEGAHLINSTGHRFMDGVPGKELAPRDVVARAIWTEMCQGSVFLDFRPIGKERILERFPMIIKTCLYYGIDVLSEPVPVAPAAHYMMGGVRTDIYGRTNLPGLYACGECACNGVHGANRLASNSLLDGLVFGGRIVEKIVEQKIGNPAWAEIMVPAAKDFSQGDLQAGSLAISSGLRKELQDIMWEFVGIVRDGDGLRKAKNTLAEWQGHALDQPAVELMEIENMITVGLAVTQAALAREESRGGHFRSDYPERDNDQWQLHSVQNKEDNHVRYIPVGENC